MSVASVLAAAISATVPAGVTAQSSPGKGLPRSGPARMQHATLVPPLIFGIYPGGGAGTVGPAGPTAPEDAAKQLAALRLLRAPGRPFVLRLYASYTGPGSGSAAEQVGREIERYTASGFRTELVLTYRPADRSPVRDVQGFVAFVRSTVRSLCSNPGLVSLQVTNEVNVVNAPNAADGYYPGAQDALIQGVIAGKAEARRNGVRHLVIGFNWAYSLAPEEAAFWRGLGRRGGAAFRRSLDWVGLDVYPGTWGPKVAGGDIAAEAAKTMLDSLTTLRDRLMPLAGLTSSVPLHVSENGYPTGPGRTEAMQVAVLEAAVAAVDAHRATYAVTDYRWFDLRDADSSGSNFESRYGLMQDNYAPKAAFVVYRNLVSTLGGTSPGGPLEAGHYEVNARLTTHPAACQELNLLDTPIDPARLVGEQRHRVECNSR